MPQKRLKQENIGLWKFTFDVCHTTIPRGSPLNIVKYMVANIYPVSFLLFT